MASLVQKISLMVLLLTGFVWLSEGEVCRECTKCPQYWMEIGEYCYQYFGNKMKFHDAENICNRIGGDLPSIRNEEEGNTIYQLWKGLVNNPTKMDYAYWIGLRDTHQEKKFEWTDGTPLQYNNWKHGEPNNWENEDCVEIRNAGNNDYERQRWNDRGCNHDRAFFCRKPLN
ncbi:alpha-N-acetylgalactosamine-specific lectin [Strongylocentrotus purpuratus]|uniref:C-type lectin domain-containing protein n=1 Tax=Strongylocentrotus purpuratus TaxID=7668 RepID=A0A7M7NRZ5_STRPU|nr:alpha-N-acetylgalactosamine-specific lectin [Strongylocentrotus purpuratus]|eukprot:XP_003727989.1 PREDICTED: alpha-N-acetylgalactosamine-specific lectin-like [Strongylocentrotus purpuratus]